jgi:lipoyl(octanoyl) transferase
MMRFVNVFNRFKPTSIRSISTSSTPKRCVVLDLPGQVDYTTAWRYQKVLNEHIHKSRKSEEPAACTILVVEHPRVFTLGRGATVDNLKFEVGSAKSAAADVIRVERGGEVTWHGPGQIVVYPILDLDNHKRDLHWYTTRLEESVIRLLKEHYDIDGGRNEVNTGVWVDQNKIAAVGVTASRWITMHGMAFNVCPAMRDYDMIVPCGIAVQGHGVCSLEQVVLARNGGGHGGDDGGNNGGGATSDAVAAVVDKAEARRHLIDKLVSEFAFDDVSVRGGTDGITFLEELLDRYPHVRELQLARNVV